MAQFEKVVLKAPEGMHYVTSEGKSGELILELAPNKMFTTCIVGEDKAKYFTKITEKDRKMVKKWLEECKGNTDREKRFLKRVNKAVLRVDYEYSIATMEPSVEGGKIYYAENKNAGRHFSCNQWKQMAESYAPERGSRLASLDELFIWYALRIVYKFWTLHYVANDSSGAGNYCNAPNSTHSFEKTGARRCGGYYDGQGNTYKIVTIEDSYVLVGGSYSNDGIEVPVAELLYYDLPERILDDSSGVLVLTK